VEGHNSFSCCNFTGSTYGVDYIPPSHFQQLDYIRFLDDRNDITNNFTEHWSNRWGSRIK